MKQNREGRKTRQMILLLGDYVLVKQPKKNKWGTPYEPLFYVVAEIRGSQITARRVTDGRTICRDASQFKLVNSVIGSANEHEDREEQTFIVIPERESEMVNKGGESDGANTSCSMNKQVTEQENLDQTQIQLY